MTKEYIHIKSGKQTRCLKCGKAVKLCHAYIIERIPYIGCTKADLKMDYHYREQHYDCANPIHCEFCKDANRCPYSNAKAQQK